MPRKGMVDRREVLSDPLYNSTLVRKFISCMMWDGKKSVAEKIFYTSMDKIRQRTNDDPVKVFKKAVENCRPLLEVKTRRVGGANYQVPVEVNSNRRTSLSVRWLLAYARGRSEKGMVEKLTREIMDAASNRGGAMKKKDETHRTADANKAFAHYRW